MCLYIAAPSVHNFDPGLTLRNRKYPAWCFCTDVPMITSYARFLVPFCLPMIKVMFLKYASSSCTICSKIWVSCGKCSLKVSNHFRTETVVSSVKAVVCFTGTQVLQHHSTIHHVLSGSLRLASQL